MKLVGEVMDGMSGDGWYEWETEEVKTEKEILNLMIKISGLGERSGFHFRGYEDMDEHGNEVSFKSVGEMQAGMKEIKRIDPDTASVAVWIDGDWVEVDFSPFCDDENGAKFTVSGMEDSVKKVSNEIKKMIAK